MASFAQSLRTFRGGTISYDDLLDEVDRILVDERADATWLLTTLSEECEKNPLPADVCDALRNKLEPLAQKQIEFSNAAGDDLNSLSHDSDRTQLAIAYQPQVPQDLDNDTADAIPLNTENVDPIKGTGDVLNNRFELQECVGSGGMSSVYKAVDRRKIEADDRHLHVAVKVLNVEFRAHLDSLMALQREAKKCQSLAHQNIVRVYDFDRDGSTVYMTMEYLSGVSLGRKMKEPGFTGLPREEALRIINNAGQALRFAHDSGIVHADFKPANVIITDKGKIKVIDFGIARAFQRDEAVEMEATRFDPGSLQALTPTYASPEMLEQQKPHPRDDVYALACTAYEMLTGRHPFGRVAATVARETGLKLQRHKALTHCQFTALKHALEFESSKRTASIDLFLKELNQTVGTIGKSVAALGIFGLLVGVSAGYYYLSGPGDNELSGITTRDSQYAVNTIIETDSLVSSMTSADSVKKPNNRQGSIGQASPLPLSSAADLELKYDVAFWEAIKDSEIAAEYQAYLESFPNGRFASDASVRIAQLGQVAKKLQSQSVSKIKAMDSKREAVAVFETPAQIVTHPVHGDAPQAADRKLVSEQSGHKSLQPQPVLPQYIGADAKRASKGEVGELARLLALAEVHFSADRLMAPKFKNALFVYNKVLRLDAQNADAQAGIKKVKAKLMSFAADAQAQNDLETARNQLMKILVIDPQDEPARAALAQLW